MEYLDKFHPNCFYHIFNHAVGSDNLFKSPDNFAFFLSRHEKYLSPVFKTYCYCLMPNHFHLLVRIRNEQSIMEVAKIEKDDDFDYHKFIMQQLSNCLNSYAKAFNKQHSRRGALFLDYTKRKQVNGNFHITNVINYIHQNPIHHGFCKKLETWPYSSYNTVIDGGPSFVERELLIDWFDGIENFISFHQNQINPDPETAIDNQ